MSARRCAGPRGAWRRGASPPALATPDAAGRVHRRLARRGFGRGLHDEGRQPCAGPADRGAVAGQRGFEHFHDRPRHAPEVADPGPTRPRPPFFRQAANSSCNEINSHLLWHHCLTRGKQHRPGRQQDHRRKSSSKQQGRRQVRGQPDFRCGAQARHPSPSFVGTAPYRGAFGSSQSPEDRESNQTPLSRSRLRPTSQAIFLFRKPCQHVLQPAGGLPCRMPPAAFLRSGQRTLARSAPRRGRPEHHHFRSMRPHGREAAAC